MMKMLIPTISTVTLPATLPILRSKLPGVLLTECFNAQNLPFIKEVMNTEIGHLYEHILLQNILESKLEKGHRRFEVVGETEWDWKKEETGTFNLRLNVGANETEILNPCLLKTNELVELILRSKRLN